MASTASTHTLHYPEAHSPPRLHAFSFSGAAPLSGGSGAGVAPPFSPSRSSGRSGGSGSHRDGARADSEIARALLGLSSETGGFGSVQQCEVTADVPAEGADGAGGALSTQEDLPEATPVHEAFARWGGAEAFIEPALRGRRTLLCTYGGGPGRARLLQEVANQAASEMIRCALAQAADKLFSLKVALLQYSIRGDAQNGAVMDMIDNTLVDPAGITSESMEGILNPLTPETVAAVADALASRLPAPQERQERAEHFVLHLQAKHANDVGSLTVVSVATPQWEPPLKASSAGRRHQEHVSVLQNLQSLVRTLTHPGSDDLSPSQKIEPPASHLMLLMSRRLGPQFLHLNAIARSCQTLHSERRPTPGEEDATPYRSRTFSEHVPLIPSPPASDRPPWAEEGPEDVDDDLGEGSQVASTPTRAPGSPRANLQNLEDFRAVGSVPSAIEMHSRAGFGFAPYAAADNAMGFREAPMLLTSPTAACTSQADAQASPNLGPLPCPHFAHAAQLGAHLGGLSGPAPSPRWQGDLGLGIAQNPTLELSAKRLITILTTPDLDFDATKWLEQMDREHRDLHERERSLLEVILRLQGTVRAGMELVMRLTSPGETGPNIGNSAASITTSTGSAGGLLPPAGGGAERLRTPWFAPVAQSMANGAVAVSIASAPRLESQAMHSSSTPRLMEVGQLGPHLLQGRPMVLGSMAGLPAGNYMVSSPRWVPAGGDVDPKRPPARQPSEAQLRQPGEAVAGGPRLFTGEPHAAIQAELSSPMTRSRSAQLVSANMTAMMQRSAGALVMSGEALVSPQAPMRNVSPTKDRSLLTAVGTVAAPLTAGPPPPLHPQPRTQLQYPMAHQLPPPVQVAVPASFSHDASRPAPSPRKDQRPGGRENGAHSPLPAPPPMPLTFVAAKQLVPAAQVGERGPNSARNHQPRGPEHTFAPHVRWEQAASPVRTRVANPTRITPVVYTAAAPSATPVPAIAPMSNPGQGRAGASPAPHASASALPAAAKASASSVQPTVSSARPRTDVRGPPVALTAAHITSTQRSGGKGVRHAPSARA